jgi:hypothetical protein
VFNLVLDSLHAIEIGGEVCVTLGHGISDDAVAAHEYFGTDKVLTFLALLVQKYLLFYYKSTNTACRTTLLRRTSTWAPRQVLTLLALLAQKYEC